MEKYTDIEAFLANEAVHDMAKRWLVEALRKDPVDAVANAEMVTRILKERLDRLQGQHEKHAA